MNHLKPLVTATQAWLRRHVGQIRGWWVGHRQRLAQEVGYADAVSAVLIAAADLVGHSCRSRYAVRELVRAYIVLQRIFSPAVLAWDDEE